MTRDQRRVFARSLRRSWILTLLLGPAVVVLMMAPQQTTTTAPSTEAAVRCMPSSENNYCAPQNNSQVAAEVSSHEATGLSCGTEPVLTDIIVFQFESDMTVRTVTLDEALALAEQGRGWVQAFCR